MAENKKHKSGFIAIVGRPNVGKSTLMNKVLGQKIAIMSDKAQTTRNRITGIYTKEDCQMVFLDTPGIHKPKNKLGEYMLDTALNSLKEIDVVIYVTDVSQELGSGEKYIMEALKKVDAPIVLVLNKVDLLSKDAILPKIAEYSKEMDFDAVVPISAARGDNIEKMLEVIKNFLPEGPQFYPEDMITDQPERLIVAELIREKVLKETREEIPHSIAVQVEQMVERSEDLIYIGATIYVERKSQKGIVIGKKGALLKEIGKEAREDIERMLGTKVFLELWVKVKEEWRRRELDVRNFGFTKD